jgi:hypothetical protein
MRNEVNTWLNFYKELTKIYQNEVLNPTHAESLATKLQPPMMVNPATLLTIGTLQVLLSLRNYANPTSTLLGWEKEAHAFLSGVSIYGVPVSPSSLPKEN